MERIDVEHVARLARIHLEESRRGKMAEQLGRILDYFEVMRSVDTGGVEPSVSAVEVQGRTRPDEIAEPFDRAALLENGRVSDDGSFVVPRVIE